LKRGEEYGGREEAGAIEGAETDCDWGLVGFILVGLTCSRTKAAVSSTLESTLEDGFSLTANTANPM
jgi:hypothetical protein